MKNLFTLRHAKSNWDAAAERDMMRPLDARGVRDAVAMGKYCKQQNLHWDLILCSPATRALETAGGIESGMGETLDLLSDERLYMSRGDELLELLAALDDAYDRVLLIGHNPGLQDLVLTLASNDTSDDFSKLARKYPAGALSEIELEISEWRQLTPKRGKIRRFIKPKQL